MSLVEIKLDPKVLQQAITLLTRIAEALERAYPPIQLLVDRKPAGPEDLFTFDAEAEWQKQEEENRRRELGLPPR